MEEKVNIEKGKYSRDEWSEFLEEARCRRNSESKEESYNDYKNEFIEFMREYAKLNKQELKESLEYYEEATSTDFFNKHYTTLNEMYIKSELSKCKVMIMTANPIEKAVLHHKIIENEKIKITRILCETTVYYIFKWKKYWIAHIHQSQTGAEKDMGTNATIRDALNYFIPNVIISLGIAFGIDYKTQNIGDVLVSKRLFPYSDNKRDEDYVKPDRTQDKTIDDWLQVRLDNAIGFLDGVTYGDILSGGSVMSSCEEKDRICLAYTKADFVIGGEMEGNAVFQNAKKIGIPGVVIKGICDWGIVKNGIYENDADREENLKNSLQAFAMIQAVEKCESLFNDKELFSSSKDIANKKLKKKYLFCLSGLMVSQLLMIINAIYLLLRNYDYDENKYIYTTGKFFAQPCVWLIIPLALLIFFVVRFIYIGINKLIWWIRNQ